MFGASSELASVMEFGFNRIRHLFWSLLAEIPSYNSYYIFCFISMYHYVVNKDSRSKIAHVASTLVMAALWNFSRKSGAVK